MDVKKRNCELDLLRFVFSVIVMFFHGRKMFDSYDGSLFQYGYTAVEFFFMVSGYLMALSAQKYKGENIAADTFDFMKKKLKTLMPFLLGAFAVSFISVEIIINKAGLKQILLNLTASIPEILCVRLFGVRSITYYNGPTWYISSMLIAMLLVFPLLLKFRDKFIYIAAPLISGTIYAFISQELNTLSRAEEWVGFTTAGNLRAIAGLCLGCICYAVVSRIKENNISLTKAGKILLMCFQLLLFTVTLILMQKSRDFPAVWKYDYVEVILLFAILTIVFSGLTGFNNLLNSSICGFLGKLSLPMFLIHRSFTKIFYHFNTGLSYAQLMPIYFALTILLSLIFLFAQKQLRKFNAQNSQKIKALFIKQDSKQDSEKDSENEVDKKVYIHYN